ncbi:hypothetical protein [Streptomyces sp. NPDC058451]
MADLRAEEPDYAPACGGVEFASGAKAAADPSPLTCKDIPPGPDRGDTHSVETDSNEDTMEVVDVGDDAPFVP